ncbi:MAG: hypothetical protein RJB01_758, partial [Actinomycetota bacterium]
MTSAGSTPSWQERIGGRWAISLPAYLVGVAVNIVILALTGGQIGGQATSLDDALAWVLIGVVASACVGAYALAVNSSLFRNRRTIPVPAWAAIGFHSGVGLIFGTIVVVVGDAFVAPNPQSPILRITVITLIGLWWGLTASLVLEARDRFNREREALLDLAVALELASISEAETVSKLRTTIARQVEPSLGSTRELVDDVLAGFTPQNQTLLPIEQWWKISTSLRTAADSTIRPLSHQLWDATSQQYPRPRLGRVLSRFGLYQGFATWQSMIILGIGFLPAGLYDLGAVWGVLATVVMVGGIGLLMSLSNAILRLTRRAHLFVFASAFMLIEVVSLLFLALLQQFREGSITWNGEFIGAAIAVAVSVLMPAAYDSLTKERSEVIQKFRIDTNKAEITQRANALRLAQVTREAARELHGSVQTRLISCAIAIEQASRKGDVEQFKQALTTSIAILE